MIPSLIQGDLSAVPRSDTVTDTALRNVKLNGYDDAAMRQAAADFETVFLTEMLAHSGVGAEAGEFGGGVGEDAFASLMTREWASLMTAQGGLGVADAIYQSLLQREGRNG